MQIHAKKKQRRKSSKQRQKVCLQIRPNACSHLAQNETAHVNKTKYHVTADPQPEPCRSVPCCRRYPEVAHNVLNTWSGCIMWLQIFTPSLTCVWPSHWVSSLCPLTQRLPNICSLSETRLIQLRRHWVAVQKVSPSGGWLSGRMWADSCPGDWRNERWSRLADHWYLPCCPRRGVRGWGVQTHLANGWYSTIAAHLKPLGWENKKSAPHRKFTDNTCKRFNIDRPPLENERDKCIALGRAYGYTFPIQVPSLKCYIKWLALNIPKWASAKWLIPAWGKKINHCVKNMLVSRAISQSTITESGLLLINVF